VLLGKEFPVPAHNGQTGSFFFYWCGTNEVPKRNFLQKNGGGGGTKRVSIKRPEKKLAEKGGGRKRTLRKKSEKARGNNKSPNSKTRYLHKVLPLIRGKALQDSRPENPPPLKGDF